MRRLSCLLLLPLALLMLLTGCASTLRSEVTTFHQWPADIAGRSFAFERTAQEEQDLHRLNIENLVRAQLLRLGLQDAPAPANAELVVRVDYSNEGRDVREVETVLVDPWYGSPWYGPGFYSPYWGWNSFGHPFYRPMWPSMPVARNVERRYTVFQRQLKIRISGTEPGRTLLDATVRSEGREGNLAKVMPYLVEAAFQDFPGPNGQPRVVEIKMKR